MQRWWIVIRKRADIWLLAWLYAGMEAVALFHPTASDTRSDSRAFSVDIAPLIALEVRTGAKRCVFENVVIGDGSIRAGAWCAPTMSTGEKGNGPGDLSAPVSNKALVSGLAGWRFFASV